MLPDMDVTKLGAEDRRRVAYYLEHNLINAISPLAACLDADPHDPRFVPAARHAKSRIVALVNEVRELAGLRPAPEKHFFPAGKSESDALQLSLRL